jgi:hypothetical protein
MSGGGAMNPRDGDNFETSEKTSKFLDGQSRVFKDSTQGSFGQFLVVWDGQPSMRWNAQPEDNVASSLMIHLIANLRKCLDELSSRDDGKLRH